MAELKERYKQVLQAYQALNESIQEFEKFSSDKYKILEIEKETLLKMFRDSEIKRFELCYDVTWKFFKHFLIEKYGVEVSSPRKVFQECFKQKITTEAETLSMIDMVDMRNEATHTYDITVAERVSEKIPECYEILVRIIKRVTLD